jgi:hypothetical protein
MAVANKKPGQARTITGPWALTLDHVNGSSEKLKLDNLVDFINDDRLRTFAGVVHYENLVEIDIPADYSHIDLGKVKGISEVIINGQSLGVKWYGWHIYALKDSLHKGNNTLHVKVTTVLGNYLKSLEDNPVCRRWVTWQKYHSTGMTGPVKIVNNPPA